MTVERAERAERAGRPERAGRAGRAGRVPVRQGLFVDADPPRLLAGTCGSCGQLHFPRHGTCPYCAGETVQEAELDGDGSLWSWTAVTAAPPGYRGEVPYGFGVVELDAGLRVVARLTEPDPSRLRAGERMRLEVVPLHRSEEGPVVVTYAFGPGRQPAGRQPAGRHQAGRQPGRRAT